MCQGWFASFETDDFDIEGNKSPGQVGKFENVELKTLFDQNPSQMKSKLPEIIEVIQQANKHSSKAMGRSVFEENHLVIETRVKVQIGVRDKYVKLKNTKGCV